MNEENIARCGVCDYIDFESAVQKHFKQHFILDEENCTEETTVEETEDSGEQGQPFKWSANDVKLLISLYEARKNDFDNPKKTNRSVWNVIALEMNKNGVNVNREQCESKLKNMKKTYKTIVDNNNSTGRGRKDWKYFEIMQNIFGKNPEVMPLSVASTSNFIENKATGNASDVESNDQNIKESVSPISLTPHSSCSIPRRKRNRENEEPLWFKRFREDSQKRHEEKIVIQKQFLEILKQCIPKKQNESG